LPSEFNCVYCTFRFDGSNSLFNITLCCSYLFPPSPDVELVWSRAGRRSMLCSNSRLYMYALSVESVGGQVQWSFACRLIPLTHAVNFDTCHLTSDRLWGVQNNFTMVTIPSNSIINQIRRYKDMIHDTAACVHSGSAIVLWLSAQQIAVALQREYQLPTSSSGAADRHTLCVRAKQPRPPPVVPLFVACGQERYTLCAHMCYNK
jgi:hypothetical protein